MVGEKDSSPDDSEPGGSGHTEDRTGSDAENEGIPNDTPAAPVPRAREAPTAGETTQTTQATLTTQRCGGCGGWVAYRKYAGYDRQMREVALLHARCPTCGWQHTKLA